MAANVARKRDGRILPRTKRARKNAAARIRRVLKKLDKLPSAPSARGSMTSRLAAESVEGIRLATLLRIRKLVETSKTRGMTCDEVEEASGFLHQTASARIYDLKKLKVLFDSGKKRYTRSKRLAVVYVVAKYRRSA